MFTKMDILTFPLSPHVLRVSILEAMTGNLLQLQPPITSMWEKTMIELTNMFLWHVRFSKQNTHKHMVSLLHLKMAFLSDRGEKEKDTELWWTKTMWHILFCSVHTSVNLQPHSKPAINSRKLCTQPLLVCSMLLLDLSVVEACGGGRNSVFAVLENCLSQKKLLMQKFCFLLVCVYERTRVCRPTEMHVYLKEWGAD